MAPVKSPHETLESQSLHNQALEHIKRNRFDKAVPLLREALHIAPDNPFYMSYLGLSMGHEGMDFELSIALCKKALIFMPGDTMIRVNLGRVYKLAGDSSNAYSIFLDAWRRNKSHPAPATELSRMGIRRPPVIRSIDRSHWLNRHLGIMRAGCERLLKRLSHA